jgi:amidase
MFTIAHANDGGGSIRIPASCCGLVGLKPSRGRVPALFTPWEGGVVEGVLVRTVADAAAVLDVISGPDRLCWYNAPAPARPFANEPGAEPGHLRIGLVTQPPLDLPIDPECLAAVERTAATLAELGHDIVAADFGFVADSLADFFNVVNSGLADYADIDWSGTEPHIQANRAAAQQIDSLTYVASVHNLQWFSRELAAKWGKDCDVLLTPKLSILPPIAGEVLAAAHAEPSAPPLQVFQMAAFNATFNISGQPAISLPLHTSSNGLPIGIQLVGGPWQEDLLLRLAAQLETAHPWADRAPDLDRALGQPTSQQ